MTRVVINNIIINVVVNVVGNDAQYMDFCQIMHTGFNLPILGRPPSNFSSLSSGHFSNFKLMHWEQLFSERVCTHFYASYHSAMTPKQF